MRLRVIDIETSGGKPSEIIEIASVDVVWGASGWHAETPRSQLFRPLGPITFHTMAIHHLTPAHFDDSMPTCDEAALKGFLALGGRADYLVAHNAAFERDHIDQQAADGLPWICTVKGAKAAWPDAPGYSNQVLRYWRGLNLDSSLAMPPHRAAPDAWVTAHILLDLLGAVSVDDLVAATGAPRKLDHIPFGKYRGQAWSVAPDDYLHWMVLQTEMASDVVARAQAEMAIRLEPMMKNEEGETT